MNLRFAAAALCTVALMSSGASSANAFGFGLLGGHGCGCATDCCEPTCGCEPSCCVAEPVCCDPCCKPRCGLFSGLKGMFHRHHCCADACCEPSCCAAEPSCCAPEPSCCVAEPSCCAAEPSCGCEPACCDPCCGGHRCKLFGGLKGLFKRHCCAPSCCEPTCGCEPSCCAVEPSCGCAG
ncbi:keratin-like protein [Botrimarina mediterranea]|uniref:keratin-like protein n=1 Tax=Botrimarina mediterranea TaxID=2528022 RepID=UPI0011A6AD88|nr:keratin-like protein [Botrimarina mediterranea]